MENLFVMKETPSWYVRKPYLHFDLPLGPTAATEYVTDPAKVAKHAFYPLLGYTLSTPRIKKSPPGSSKPFVKEPKERPIAYPAHKDGYIFSYYKRILEQPYEDWLRENHLGEAVTAFRSIGENNVTLAKKAFDFIKANPGCQIVVTDVEDFFGNVNHTLLKQTWARFLGQPRLPDDHYAVYKAITHYSVVMRHKAFNLFRIRLNGRLDKDKGPDRLCTPKQFREKVVAKDLVRLGPGGSIGKGIPQGTSLSPLLSNMYMADLDLAMYKWVDSFGGKYWRYCDDVLIVIPPPSPTPKNILSKLDEQLHLLNLTRSCPKTHIFDSRELRAGRQLQYLGFVFNGDYAVIRSSSIHRYHRKSKKAVTAAEIRRRKESHGKSGDAPLRKQALYNMYSELPVKGRKAKARQQHRKFRGNFTHYMERAAKRMNSPSIERQRRRLLKRFRGQLRK